MGESPEAQLLPALKRLSLAEAASTKAAVQEQLSALQAAAQPDAQGLAETLVSSMALAGGETGAVFDLVTLLHAYSLAGVAGASKQDLVARSTLDGQQAASVVHFLHGVDVE